MDTSSEKSSPPMATPPGDPEQTVLVPVEKVVESKTNPRKYLDPQREKEIFESVKAKGIIAPLLVRPVNGKMEIVEGARRYRAAKAASLASVPAIVRPYTDDEAFEIQLISFTQRVDIHPLDEAAAYEALRKKKFSIAQISDKVGKERSYIAKHLQLIALIEPAKKQLAEGRITLAHAIELARIRPEMQKEALNEMRYGVKTVSALHEFIQENLLLDLDSVSFLKDDTTLLPKAGPCTTCPKRSGNSPDLFGDISKKGNHCLDRECFTAKTDAFPGQKLAEAEAQGKDLIRITDDYRPTKGVKAIGTKDYSVVGKRDATGEGIYVDGPDAGKVVPIRVRAEKAASGGASPAASGKKLRKAELQKRYKRRLEIFENKIEQDARLTTYNKLVLRLKWPMDRKDFEIVLIELMENSDYDTELVADVTAIKLFRGFGHQVADSKDLAKLTDQQLVQAAFAVILNQELIADPLLHQEPADRMESLSSRHGIDHKIHQAASTEKLKPKKPKPPKVEEPKKTSKKPDKPAKAVAVKKAKAKKTAKKAKAKKPTKR